MDRRNFLRSMLGVAATTALPSEVWPFRKIFLPPAPARWFWTDWGRGDKTVWYINRDQLAAIEAIELESLREEIPKLFENGAALYRLLKKSEARSRYFDRIVQPGDIVVATPGGQAVETAVRFDNLIRTSQWPG